MRLASAWLISVVVVACSRSIPREEQERVTIAEAAVAAAEHFATATDSELCEGGTTCDAKNKRATLMIFACQEADNKTANLGDYPESNAVRERYRKACHSAPAR
jgi:hypothetical protein